MKNYLLILTMICGVAVSAFADSTQVSSTTPLQNQMEQQDNCDADCDAANSDAPSNDSSADAGQD